MELLLFKRGDLGPTEGCSSSQAPPREGFCRVVCVCEKRFFKELATALGPVPCALCPCAHWGTQDCASQLCAFVVVYACMSVCVYECVCTRPSADTSAECGGL